MKGFDLISKNPEIIWISDKSIDVLRLESEFYKIEYLQGIEKIAKCPNMLLGDISEDVKDGPGGWGIKASEYVNNGVPMLRGVNIIDGLLSIEDCVYITEEKQKELKRSAVKKNDVLLAVRGSVGIGKSAVYSKPYDANMNAAVVKITLKEDIANPYYISCFFNSRYGRLQTERLANGVNQQNTNLTEVRSNIIPIPSLEVQRYIGRKVQKAEEVREVAKNLRNEAQNILNRELKIDLYREKINQINSKSNWIKTDILTGRIDSEFYAIKVLCYEQILSEFRIQTIKLGEIANSIKTGTTPKEEFITSQKQKHVFLKMTNIEDFRINDNDILYIKDSYDGKKIRIINKGDLLISIAGTIGKSMVLDIDNCTINQNTASISIINKDLYNTYYISLFINSDIGKLMLERVSSQATIKYINNEILSQVEIPIIQPSIQNEIEEKILGYLEKMRLCTKLIEEAKKDVEDLIEGKFDISKIEDTANESR